MKLNKINIKMIKTEDLKAKLALMHDMYMKDPYSYGIDQIKTYGIITNELIQRNIKTVGIKNIGFEKIK